MTDRKYQRLSKKYRKLQKKYTFLKRKFETLVDLSSDGYWEWNMDTPDVEYLSPRFKQILGYRDEEMENRPESWQKLLDEKTVNEVTENLTSHLKDSSKPFYQIVKYKHRTGRDIWILCRGAALQRRNHKPFVIGTHTDITEIRGKAKRREEKGKTFVEVKDFLAKMSHEIRTPMNGVIGLLQLATMHPNSENNMHLITKAHESSEILLKLLDDILDYSKFEASSLSLDKDLFNITELFYELVRKYRKICNEKNLIFTEDIPDQRVMCMGDKIRIRQVVENVLSNAAKYTLKGRVHFAIEYSSKITIKVSDTGVGIPEENYDYVFAPFKRLREDVCGGTGLGMSICENIITLIGGKIFFESKVDVGTTFTIILPFDTTINDNDLRIAVAEDNPVNRFVIEEQLKMLGFKCVIVNSGPEIVDLAGNMHLDIIFMDVSMPPGYGGTQATKLIRQFDKTVYIVAMTANALSGDREKYLGIMDDYISKPVDIEEVRRVLNKISSGKAIKT